MPAIRLAIGAMALESDETVKNDTVVAHLYNGYRIADSIKSIPGHVEWCDLGTGNATVDGDYYSTLHDVRIAVSDGRAWKIDRGGIKTELSGVLIENGTPVSFTEDKNAIYFAANSYIHKYTGGVSVTLLQDQAPRNVRSLAWISGFLVAAGDDATGTPVPGDVWYSDDEGYVTWEVFNAEAVPDRVQNVFATYSELYAIGRESVEVNYLSGDVGNPFAANKAASQPFGTPAAYSVAFDQQSIYYLTTVGGSRRLARLIGGREPQIISFAVDVPIGQIEDVSTARAWIHSFEGQTFYVISFPNANITIGDMVHESVTFAFNMRVQEWYIWGGWFDQQGQYRRYPADTFLFVEPWGKRFVGYQGKIYELAGNSFPDSDLRPALRTGWRSWGSISREKMCRCYVYDIKRGESSSESVFQHRWRNDGNLEWNNPRQIDLGTTGNRRTPAKSYQCGKYYKRQDEFIFPAGVDMVINGIEEEWEALR